MELAKLIVSFITSLIWPGVVLIIVLMFRDAIKKRIPDIQTIELPGGIKAKLNGAKVKAIIEETTNEMATSDVIEKEYISKQFNRIALQIDNPPETKIPITPPLPSESTDDDGSWTMLAFATGESQDDNIEYDIYYDPADRNHNWPFKYIGLYAGKKVFAVGTVMKIVYCDYQEGKLFGTRGYDISTLTTDEYSRIKMTIETTEYYDLRKGHKFFLVDKFCKTTFTKTSAYAIRAKRYFWLDEIDGFKEGISAEELARLLNGKEWE